MVDDGQLAVGLLDLQLRGGGLHAEDVVVRRVYNHCVGFPSQDAFFTVLLLAR